MDILDAIRGRRAVREYTPEPVRDAVIRELVDAAVQAPSAMNEQPWHFTVVRGRQLLERLSADAKAHMMGTLPPAASADHLRGLLRDGRFDIFYHAPALIVISALEAGSWAVEDCALAAENLMLAAHACGLGSCWIGFAQGYLNTPQGRAQAGLPTNAVAVAPIIVGHAASQAAAVPRKEPRIAWVG